MRALIAIAFGIVLVAAAVSATYENCQAPIEDVQACFQNQEMLMNLVNHYAPGAMDDDDDMTTLLSDNTVSRVRIKAHVCSIHH